VLQKKASARVFKDLRSNVEKPIAAILTLNTIANTAGAAIAGSMAAIVLGHERLGYFSAFLTIAILLFSEVTPKRLGVLYAKSLLPVVAFPLKGLVWIMTPAVWVVGLVTGFIGRRRPEDSISSEELRTMARLSFRAGGIKEYQESVIDNILSLERRIVRDVMTPRTVVFSLSEHLTLEAAAEKASQWEHSRFPVYDKDTEDLVGIFLTKELFITLAHGEKEKRLTDIMRPAHFVVETAKLSNVLMEFMSSRQHLFVVIDEYGGLSGLISLEDILEEILGREIMGESDQVADKRELARQRRKTVLSGTSPSSKERG
jgi:CBS domain containing-hemolysin-like protein